MWASQHQQPGIDIECQGLGPGKLWSAPSPVAGSWLDVWPTSVLVGKQAAVVQATAAARGRETLSGANCRSYSNGQQILALFVLILQSFLPKKIGSNDLLEQRDWE